MTKQEKFYLIYNYLYTLFPDAKCELNYNHDYEFLIAVMLSAQTTDKAVNKVTAVLFDKYSDLKSLQKATISDIENTIKAIGLYKNKAKNLKEIVNILIEKHNSKVPEDKDVLTTFPGVGIKTAGVVRAELFNIPEFPVDTHVARVSKRLGLAKEEDDVGLIERKLKKITPINDQIKAHHLFIHFGRYFCTAKKPNCKNCQLKDICKKPTI